MTEVNEEHVPDVLIIIIDGDDYDEITKRVWSGIGSPWSPYSHIQTNYVYFLTLHQGFECQWDVQMGPGGASG